MARATDFTRADAVDVWDAEFRWRRADRLLDVTVDDTWRRVADAAAAVEGPRAATWAASFADAFRRWRLLPEARLLRQLGTGRWPPSDRAPAAVLNVAAFVATTNGTPWFDHDRFTATAALAVRFLDDVARGVDATRGDGHGLRVGIVGLADALAALGLAYDSDAGRDTAERIARALADGCARGAGELAAERGHAPKPGALTALDRHPLVARLANGVADGIDPCAANGSAPAGAAGEGARARMAARLQPWIDAPIAN